MNEVKRLVEEFARPADEYYPKPFWFLNDELEEGHLDYQLDEMREKGIREALLHARLGLGVPYLSEQWFEKIGYIIADAKKRGMKVWIYDEENWPSGYAGGRILQENSSFAAQYLMREKTGTPLAGRKLVAEADGYQFVMAPLHYHPAYAEGYYVDLLNPNATDCFLKTTHEEYYRRFSEEFGKTILGFFVDEPGFYNNFEMYAYAEDHGSLVWTEEFPEYFKKKKGYDVLENLNALFSISPENASVRVDFYDAAAEMYAENFLDRLAAFCHRTGVQLIGHVHSEEFLPYHVKTQGDCMKVLSHLDWSGVDRIDTNPEKVTEKYGSSAAHVYGKEQCLSETFCLSGWDLNFKRMRQWTNWQYVRGVNTMILHAFYSSIEGDRKWECPPTLFFQNPHWKYFQTYSDFCARLSLVTRAGTFSAPAAVYYPITTQQETVLPEDFSAATAHDRLFIDVSNRLLDAQLDFDYLNDDALLSAEAKGGVLTQNGISYRFAVLVELKNIPYRTLLKLAEFAECGGSVVWVGRFAPHRLNDCSNEEFQKALARLTSGSWFHMNEFWYNKPYTYEFSAEKLSGFVRGKGLAEVSLQEPDREIKVMHRRLSGGDLYYVVNEADAEKANRLTVRAAGKYVYLLDAATGKILGGVPNERRGEELLLAVRCLPLAEEIFLVTDETLTVSGKYETYSDYQAVSLTGNWEISCPAFSGEFPLASWSELGAPEYSGLAVYRKTFRYTAKPGKRYVLKLTKVYHTAEVRLNGKEVAALVWEPYAADITDALRDGENELELTVGNTLANELEKRPYLSGIIGDVNIYAIEERQNG